MNPKKLNLMIILARQVFNTSKEALNRIRLNIEIIFNNKKHFTKKSKEVYNIIKKEIDIFYSMYKKPILTIQIALKQVDYEYNIDLCDFYFLSYTKEELLKYYEKFIKEIDEYADLFYINLESEMK